VLVHALILAEDRTACWPRPACSGEPWTPLHQGIPISGHALTLADAIIPLSYKELTYARRHRMQLSQSYIVVVVAMQVAMASCCDRHQAYRELHGRLLILEHIFRSVSALMQWIKGFTTRNDRRCGAARARLRQAHTKRLRSCTPTTSTSRSESLCRAHFYLDLAKSRLCQCLAAHWLIAAVGNPVDTAQDSGRRSGGHLTRHTTRHLKRTEPAQFTVGR
jgi:hypothetical protein